MESHSYGAGPWCTSAQYFGYFLRMGVYMFAVLVAVYAKLHPLRTTIVEVGLACSYSCPHTCCVALLPSLCLTAPLSQSCSRSFLSHSHFRIQLLGIDCLHTHILTLSSTLCIELVVMMRSKELKTSKEPFSCRFSDSDSHFRIGIIGL